MSLSYNKWEELGQATDEDELRQIKERRAARKAKFDEEQKRRREEWQRRHPHEHAHSHALEQMGCCCGYADPDVLVQQHQQRQENPEPEISLEEKNLKKMAAIEATRIDGNDQFSKKDYELAFRIYERGVFIINGCYQLTEEQELFAREHEIILHLNMAACRLQQEQWREAIAYCQVVLKMDPENVKAHFREGQAYVGIGDFDQARKRFQQALELDPAQAASVQKQLDRIKALEKRAELARRKILRAAASALVAPQARAQESQAQAQSQESEAQPHDQSQDQSRSHDQARSQDQVEPEAQSQAEPQDQAEAEAQVPAATAAADADVVESAPEADAKPRDSMDSSLPSSSSSSRSACSSCSGCSPCSASSPDIPAPAVNADTANSGEAEPQSQPQ